MRQGDEETNLSLENKINIEGVGDREGYGNL